jgi:hypothetical protein
MSDLTETERARAALTAMLFNAMPLDANQIVAHWTQVNHTLDPLFDDLLAAARREGAHWMRDQATGTLRKLSSRMDTRALWMAANVVSDLPLEEPQT